MYKRERYFWDLTGYLVLRQVLTAEEVKAANDAYECSDLTRTTAGKFHILLSPRMGPLLLKTAGLGRRVKIENQSGSLTV